MSFYSLKTLFPLFLNTSMNFKEAKSFLSNSKPLNILNSLNEGRKGNTSFVQLQKKILSFFAFLLN